MWERKATPSSSTVRNDASENTWSVRSPPGSRRQPLQTLAFRRVLQTAVLHVQSAGRGEADVGDVLAALLREPRSHAAALLGELGVTRLDVLNYISHGITKSGSPAAPREQPARVSTAARIAPLSPRAAIASIFSQPSTIADTSADASWGCAPDGPFRPVRPARRLRR